MPRIVRIQENGGSWVFCSIMTRIGVVVRHDAGKEVAGWM